MATLENKPIGFFKFIIVASIVMNVWRMVASNSRDGSMSMIPFAVGLWIAYRFARTQPWWPFSVSKDRGQRAASGGTQDANQVQIPDVFRELAKPLKPGYKPNQQSKNVLGKVAVKRIVKSVGQVITEKYAPKARPSGMANEATEQTNYAKSANELTARELAQSKMSNVGVRTRRIRFKRGREKVVRYKTNREKRRPFVFQQ